MSKKYIYQSVVILFLTLLPAICQAKDRDLVASSFYTGSMVSLLIFLAGLLNAGYIFNFLRKEKFKSPSLVSLGLYWLFCGLAGLSFAVSSYMHAILDVENYIFDIIAFHVMTFHAMSVTYYVLYKNFGKKLIALSATLFVFAFVLLFSYFLITGQWRGFIQSDWGAIALPPTSAKYLTLLFGIYFVIVVFGNFFICVYHLIKKRDLMNRYDFSMALAIAIFYAAGIVQMNDLPGWRLVLDRIFMLAGFFTAFLTVYQTKYLPLVIEKESKTNNRNISEINKLIN
jgi:hypothetical protein